ncbi:hypothetical protein FRC09_005796 [Ceratobasidium sp. 395]|nr:hypothetical protein FRC09_005796 [Ceratobasidium sp. 395]
MALRTHSLLLKTPRLITTSRYYTTEFPGPAPGRGTRPRVSLSEQNQADASDSGSRSTPDDPSSSESHSSAKIFSHTGPVILPRRPAVRPPPTLTLPPSVSSPSLRTSRSKNKKPSGVSIERDGKSIGDGLWNIYQESLVKHNTDPTLEDLEGLRPADSTIRAALDGVPGAGRTLLPEGHQLHLDPEHLGAHEVSAGGGPTAKKKIAAGSGKAKKLEYLALYEATEHAISHRFTVIQLQNFEKTLKIRKMLGGGNDSKQKIIHRIMNSCFGMIHPSVIKNRLTDAPIKTQECRDGSNLLQVSKQLQMDISVDREQAESSKEPPTFDDTQNSSSRFVLRASGVKAGHQKLEQYLKGLRKSIVSRLVVLPTGPSLSSSCLQDISRTVGAFCENVRSSQDLIDGAARPSVLITAQDARNAYTAERLVQRAAMEIVHRSNIDVVSLTQPIEATSAKDAGPKYSLYPFSLQASRLQRVKHIQRLPENASLENLVRFQYRGAKSEHTADSSEAVILDGPTPAAELKGQQRGGKPGLLVMEDNPSSDGLVATNIQGKAIDLRQLLFHARPIDKPERRVVATFGHVLFKNTGISKLPPSFQSPAPIGPALEWAADQTNSSRSFAPGVVPPLIRLASGPAKTLHQLQYRTVGGVDVITVHVELPSQNHTVERTDGAVGIKPNEHDTADRIESTGKRGETDLGNTPEFRVAPVQTSSDDQEQSDSAEPRVEKTETENPTDTAKPMPLTSEILAGNETTVEVLIADGFTTDDDMFQPDPPQYLSLNGTDYTLVKNISGRQSVAPVSFDGVGSTVTTGTTLDLENNDRISFTQASCLTF